MTAEQPRRKARVLTRLRIDEVSMVDKGAGQDCRVVISKRDDSSDDTSPLTNAEKARAQLAGREALHHQEEIEKRAKRDRDDEDFQRYYDLVTGRTTVQELYGTNKSLAAGDEATRREGATPVSDLADGDPPPPDVPVPETDKSIRFDIDANHTLIARDQRALARWLAIQERIRKSNSEDTMSEFKTKLSDLAKRVGSVAIAKTIVEDQNAYGITEHELTALVTECAKREHPQLSDAQAFVKVYTAQDEGGAMLRRAFHVVKAAAETPYPFPKL